MKLHRRNYQDDNDYWRIRAFLRQAFLLSGGQEQNWQVHRFDYWRWHGVENLDEGPMQEKVFLWEDDAGQIRAVLNPEAPGHAFLQTHPGFRYAELEKEMLDTAEDCLSVERDGRQRLLVWADENNRMLQDHLSLRGYCRLEDSAGYKRWRNMSEPIPDRPVAEGYTVRSLGDESELPARSWASFRGFHPHDPEEDYQGWEWYRNLQRAPLYRRDLDIVAAAENGEIASFCTVWFDDVTRTGEFEPVATVPGHLRRGLASAVMLEGLRRLKRMGATLAFVGSYGEAAHSLYESLGFTDYIISMAWEKVF